MTSRLTPKLRRQLEAMPKDAFNPAHSEEYDQKQYLKTRTFERDKILKQFCKHEVPTGYNSAYAAGWERIFGKRSTDG